MYKILIIIGLILSSFYLSAQYSNANIDKQLRERGEVYISISKSEAINNQKALASFDYDKSEKSRLYFYANQSAIKSIKSKSIDILLEPIPSLLHKVRMLESTEAFSSVWDAYPTYQQYDSIMHKFALDFPELCKVYNLGTLQSGRKILAVQLGDSVDVDQHEPSFLYTSTMHGDETVGYIMSLRLIEYLLQNYNSDPQVKLLMDSIDIWINPLANPDGTYYTGNNSVNGAKRYNENNVDINRNFPDPEDGLHPDGNQYQQETQVFMSFADSVDFVMSANMHSGVEVVNYPWDTWAQLHADDAWWVYVSKMFADTVHVNSPNGYMTMFGSGYTNGFQWYSVWGSRQDYMNYYKHCREFTLELSGTKLLPENQLQAHWEYLKPSLLNYMQEVTYGLHGRVTDSITGFAVKAKVKVLNHDVDSSLIYCSDSGYYHRPILAGNYNVKFSAFGYKSKIININSYNAQAVINNVELAPGADYIVDINYNPKVEIFPIPSHNKLNISSEDIINKVEIYDIHGRIVYEIANNNKQFIISIDSLKSGIYFLRLISKEGVSDHKIIIN